MPNSTVRRVPAGLWADWSPTPLQRGGVLLDFGLLWIGADAAQASTGVIPFRARMQVALASRPIAPNLAANVSPLGAPEHVNVVYPADNKEFWLTLFGFGRNSRILHISDYGQMSAGRNRDALISHSICAKVFREVLGFVAPIRIRTNLISRSLAGVFDSKSSSDCFPRGDANLIDIPLRHKNIGAQLSAGGIGLLKAQQPQTESYKGQQGGSEGSDSITIVSRDDSSTGLITEEDRRGGNGLLARILLICAVGVGCQIYAGIK